MRVLLLLVLSLFVSHAADDWAKVKSLKTGAELRVYKKGAGQPIAAQMGDLTDENLIILVKKTETAIPRDQIERIDARPPSGSRVTKESSTKDSVGPDGSNTTSASSGYSFGGKPDFETVYRRTAPSPKR